MVVGGTAKVTLDGRELTIPTGGVVDVPVALPTESKHRQLKARLIEMQQRILSCTRATSSGFRTTTEDKDHSDFAIRNLEILEFESIL